MKWGFTLGVILAGVCLLGALGHHIWFMRQVDNTMNAVKSITEAVAANPQNQVPGATTLRYALATSSALMRTSLLSTGIMVGLAFGFLGFALFVMGITGAAKLNAEGHGARVSLENAAPGLVVLVVAAMLIGVCVVQPVGIEFTPPSSPATSQTQGAAQK
jgi:hypothetical protein